MKYSRRGKIPKCGMIEEKYNNGVVRTIFLRDGKIAESVLKAGEIKIRIKKR